MIHTCCKMNTFPSRFGPSIYQCASCGLAWQWPQPSNIELQTIYSSNYYNSWGTGECEPSYWPLKRSLARNLINKLALSRPSRVLDVGCATGACLSVISERGMEAFGTDVNPYATKIAAKMVPSAQIITGTVHDTPGWEGSFDAIIMSDVLEHTQSPLAELERVHALLKPMGLLLILTPNIQELSAKLMGKYWIHLKTEHLFYFSVNSLALLIERCGFEPPAIQAAKKTMNFKYAANQFRAYRIPVLSSLFAASRKILPEAIQRAFFAFPMGEMICVTQKPGGVHARQ